MLGVSGQLVISRTEVVDIDSLQCPIDFLDWLEICGTMRAAP
jgi:hypothetical protein